MDCPDGRQGDPLDPRRRDCVYLFREDMSGLYLALSQGVTAPRRTLTPTDFERTVRGRVDALRSLATNIEGRGFRLDDDMDLRGNDHYARDYVTATAAYRFYGPDTLPSDTGLADDLEMLLSVYDRYLETKSDGREYPQARPESSGAEVRGSDERQYWALVADPKLYRIEAAIRDRESTEWTTKGRQIKRGDRVAIWKTRGRDADRGVIALGEVLRFRARSGGARSVLEWIARVRPGRRVGRGEVRPGAQAAHLGAESRSRQPQRRACSGRYGLRIRPDQWELLVAAACGWPEEELSSETATRGEGVRLPSAPVIQIRKPARELTMEWLQAQTLWTREELEQVCEAVRSESYQLILAGPPGTSKTWVANMSPST